MVSERPVPVKKKIYQALQHCYGATKPRVSSFTEEVRDKAGVRKRTRADRGLELVDNATKQHRLAFACIALDPEQARLVVAAPALELRVVENPFIQVL
jgi:hypothetical protein